MTSFFNETPFVFPYNKNSVKRWVKSVAKSEGKEAGNINYIFCDDEYLVLLRTKILPDTLQKKEDKNLPWYECTFLFYKFLHLWQ